MKKRIVKQYLQITSTNSVAMELGLSGAAAGTVVVADSQTGGRGRLNRSWFSPSGAGLYFSVLLRPSIAVCKLPQITLGIGVAICKGIEKECGIRPGLKWPNDLLLDNKKLGGILTETGSISGEGKASGPLVIAGIGLNVTTPEIVFPPDLRPQATSLFISTGRVFSRKALLEAILNEIDDSIADLEAGRFSSILDQWQIRDAMKGKILSWLAPTDRKVTGEALGIDADGRYRIRDKTGTVHEVLSGDISPAGT